MQIEIITHLTSMPHLLSVRPHAMPIVVTVGLSVLSLRVAGSWPSGRSMRQFQVGGTSQTAGLQGDRGDSGSAGGIGDNGWPCQGAWISHCALPRPDPRMMQLFWHTIGTRDLPFSLSRCQGQVLRPECVVVQDEYDIQTGFALLARQVTQTR
jgi:hypothetical protein